MTLATQLQNFAVRVATESKALRTLINGNSPSLSGLNTTAKSNLVAAINEVLAAVPAGSASISDTTIATTSAWSSQKTSDTIEGRFSALVAGSPAALDTLNELATALGNDANFAATTAVGLASRVRIDAAQTFTAQQQLQGRANIGAASAVDVGNTDVDLVSTFVAALA